MPRNPGRVANRSKADRPPRKVIVGTTIFGPYGKYPGLKERLDELGGLVDDMARARRSSTPAVGWTLPSCPNRWRPRRAERPASGLRR